MIPLQHFEKDWENKTKICLPQLSCRKLQITFSKAMIKNLEVDKFSQKRLGF